MAAFLAWTAMELPFTRAAFFEAMAAYNDATWPAQFALELAALAVLWLALRRPRQAGRAVAGMLAGLWAWMAVAYHWLFFTAINPAAWLFGAVFMAGAAALLWSGLVKRGLSFGHCPRARRAAGWALVLFALVAYPLVGWLAGHRYPAFPTFGLPCPTTIFTIGVLLWAEPSGSRWLHVVPLAWTAVGSTAAFLLGVYGDLGLVVAGLASAWALLGPAARRTAEPLPSR